MQRKFVREVPLADVTYKNFRNWLGIAVLSEEMWEMIMDEDELYDYSTSEYEVIPPAIESEITLSSSGSDYLRDPGEEAEATDSEGRD